MSTCRGWGVLFLIVLVGCSSPPPSPVDGERLMAALSARDADARALESALQMVSRRNLKLLPSGWSERLTASSPDFWVALTLVWNPGVREQRRRLEALQHRASGAGLPGPVGVNLSQKDWSDGNLSREADAALDLLGLMGLGQAGAASLLADSEVREAVGRLEEASWEAAFATKAMLVQLAALRGELADLAETDREAGPGVKRAEALVRHGRIGKAAGARVRAFRRRLQARIATLRAEESQLVALIGQQVGLIPEEVGADAIQAEMLEFLAPPVPTTEKVDAEALLAQHPLLRRQHLAYAVAEAQVQRAAAEAWPRINVGPRFEMQPDDFLTGGILSLSFPWPGRVEAEVQAALALRERSREVLEDSFLEVVNRRHALSLNCRALARSVAEESLPAYQASQLAWRGFRARFQVEEESWDLWTDGLRLRQNAIEEYWQQRRLLALARVDWARDAWEGGDHE